MTPAASRSSSPPWLCVVVAGWMARGTHVTDVGDVTVQFEPFDEGATGVDPTLDLEGEHRTRALGAYFAARSWAG